MRLISVNGETAVHHVDERPWKCTIRLLSGSKPFGMKGIEGICRIAGVQAEPVMFDKRASLEKALRCIGEAAAHHPNLIVFPSSSFPVIPLG